MKIIFYDGLRAGKLYRNFGSRIIVFILGDEGKSFFGLTCCSVTLRFGIVLI